MENLAATDVARLRLERDLFWRLLELGGREDLRPFLEDALRLIVEVTGAQKGYLELHSSNHGATSAWSHTPAAERPAPFWIASGFSDEELALARRALSSGIVAEAIASGRTVSTASASEDPRFRGHASVQAQRLQAVICAPVGHDPAIGVVYVAGRAAVGPFPESDRQHVELFARHLAPLADRLLAREDKAIVDHTIDLRARLVVEGIVGQSRALAEVFRQVLVAAPVPVAVLITGESGTGKTAIARALHESSPRARGPFVELNCAAIPETLFESELFGAEKGAHSTATRRIEGKVDAARGGTLFLDEVAEMPVSVQSKLLTFLQSRRYYRLGSSTAIEADVRVLAATNADLQERVRERRFREDLYYRLNVLEVRVPPLRERTEDVAAIADQIVRGYAATHEPRITLSRAAKIALTERAWLGNVRELDNAVQRGWAVALSQGSSTIDPRHLFPERANEPDGASETYEDAQRRFQGRFLREALEANAWNVSETARRVGLARSHLNDLIKVHGLTRGRK